MDYYIIPSGDRKPASDEMLVRLVALPASRLEGLCQQASSVGIWGVDPCTYCSRDKAFALCCSVGSEDLMPIVDQTRHAWEGVPHFMEFSDQFLIIKHYRLSPPDKPGLRSITRSSVDRSISVIPAMMRGVSVSWNTRTPRITPVSGSKVLSNDAFTSPHRNTPSWNNARASTVANTPSPTMSLATG